MPRPAYVKKLVGRPKLTRVRCLGPGKEHMFGSPDPHPRLHPLPRDPHAPDRGDHDRLDLGVRSPPVSDKREEVARLLRDRVPVREIRGRVGCGNQLIRDVARDLKEAPPMTRMRLADLHITTTLQTRGGTDKDAVRDYTAAAKAGAKFPALLAFKVTDRKFPGPVLVAGFHRHTALTAAEIEEWDVEVREGTYAEAWLAGWLSNMEHGLRYSNPDKRKAAERALMLFKGESARDVADRLGLSHNLLATVRKELVAANKLEPLTEVKTKDGGTQKVKSESEEVSSDDTSSDQKATDTNQKPTAPAPSANGTPTDRPCPYCRVAGGVKPGCEWCHGTDRLPADVAERAERLVADGAVPAGDVSTQDPAAAVVGRINRVCHQLDALKPQIAEIAADPYGRHIHLESVTLQIEAARKALWQSRPTEPCNCVRGGVSPQAACKACFGTGRTTAARVLRGVK